MTDERNPMDASQKEGEPKPIEGTEAAAGGAGGSTSEPRQEAGEGQPEPAGEATGAGQPQTTDQEPQGTGEQPQPVGAKPEAVAKKRSPVERVVVWAVILVLAIVAALQWRARRSFSQAVKGVRAALRASDESLHDVTLEEAEKLIHGAKFEQAPKQGPYEVRVYRWKGPLRAYTLRLQVTQDEVPIVLAMDTVSDPAAPIGPLYDPYYRPKKAVGVDETSPEEEGEEEEMEEAEAGPGGGASGERGRRRSFEDLDANGDGKLTPDELPERMRQSFDRMDANKDGSIDKEELEAARKRRAEQRRQPREEAAEEGAKPPMNSSAPKPAETANPASKSNRQAAKPTPKPGASQPAPKPSTGQPASKSAEPKPEAEASPKPDTAKPEPQAKKSKAGGAEAKAPAKKPAEKTKE